MKREIKFRGYNLARKEWVYGYFMQFGTQSYIVEYGQPGIPAQTIEVDPKSVGQFTGMTDKVSKYIFEGDIVKHPMAGTRSWDKTKDCYVVEMNKGAYMVTHWLHKSQFRLFSSDRKYNFDVEIEVIGNIYENPELLKR